MAWIESHQSIKDHPKTKRLARTLGVDRHTAIGLLHELWWWVLDYADDGDLSRYEDADIADGLDWAGDAPELVRALVVSGFIDNDRRVHDWSDYAGRMVERRSAERERSRQRRTTSGRPADNQRTTETQPTAHHDETDQRPADDHRTTVQRPADDRATTVGTYIPDSTGPDSTGPDSTGPNRTGDTPLSPPAQRSDTPSAATARAAPPPHAAPEDEPIPLHSRQAPKPNKFAEVLDAIQQLAPDHEVGGDKRIDAAAVKHCPAGAVRIAQAYVAALNGEWGDDWFRDNLSIQSVVRKLGGYEAHLKAQQRPSTDRRAPPPRRGDPSYRPDARPEPIQSGADVLTGRFGQYVKH